MHQPSGQSASSGTVPVFDSEPVLSGSGRPRALPLAAETLLITVGVLAAIRAVDGRSVSGLQWLFAPSILVLAALLPTWLAGRTFPRIRFDPEHFKSSLRLTCGACALIIGAAFLAIWLLTGLNLPIPLKPAIAGQNGWLSWLLYQFLYVAVAEEVFFRGYVQTNVMEVLERIGRISPARRRGATIVVSAACFAVAHVVVQGQVISSLTFFPGLVMAWLFLRTGSLLAPILLHGLANIAYGVIALNLA